LLAKSVKSVLYLFQRERLGRVGSGKEQAMRISKFAASAALASLALSAAHPVAAVAGETIVYSYDALGRLTASTRSGGPNSGIQTNTLYDPSGNRKAQAVGTAAAPEVNAAVFAVSGPAAVDAGGTSVFTVTKTGTASSSLSVNYATADGTALAGTDYTAASGTLSFRDWETQRRVSVATLVPGSSRPSRSFSLVLSTPANGATIGTASASASINAYTVAQPPVTQSDSATVHVCDYVQVNVVANDSDPGGLTPLSLVSANVTSGASLGAVSVVSSTDVLFTANGTTGQAQITYTVHNTAGATATGILAITILNGTGCQ
jgi:YD repeat-containing protein